MKNMQPFRKKNKKPKHITILIIFNKNMKCNLVQPKPDFFFF